MFAPRPGTVNARQSAYGTEGRLFHERASMGRDGGVANTPALASAPGPHFVEQGRLDSLPGWDVREAKLGATGGLAEVGHALVRRLCDSRPLDGLLLHERQLLHAVIAVEQETLALAEALVLVVSHLES